MPGKLKLLSPIFSDYRRYRATGREEGSAIAVLLLTQGFWASTSYRIGAVLVKVRVPVLRQLGQVLAVLLRKTTEIVTGVCLPAEARIGPGLYIGHFGPIIVHPRTVIGSNCNLSQGVTIGMRKGGPRHGVPKLGNRVYIGPNAILIGAIEVGDDAAIGAGAVVVKDVPPRGVVIGNPGRVVNRRGSFDLVTYDGQETDPERSAALAAASSEGNAE